MDEKISEKKQRVVEEKYVGSDRVAGEIFIDAISEKDIRPADIERIKRMLHNTVSPLVLNYDMTRNEAVTYLLYQDGYSNGEVCAIMSALFGKSFWKQNINDYCKKAQAKIDRGNQFFP